MIPVKSDNARLAADVLWLLLPLLLLLLIPPLTPPVLAPGKGWLVDPGVAGEQVLSVEEFEWGIEPGPSAVEVSLLLLAVSKILLPLK